MVRTLKDTFMNWIEYIAWRQKKDEELLKILVLFLLNTDSIKNIKILSKVTQRRFWQLHFKSFLLAFREMNKSLPCVKGGGTRSVTEGL